MKITLSKQQWEGIGKKAGWIKEAKSPLTPEDKRRRANIISRIKEWEKILQNEKDPTVVAIGNDNLKSLREFLRKGDEI